MRLRWLCAGILLIVLLFAVRIGYWMVLTSWPVTLPVDAHDTIRITTKADEPLDGGWDLIYEVLHEGHVVKGPFVFAYSKRAIGRLHFDLVRFDTNHLVAVVERENPHEILVLYAARSWGCWPHDGSTGESPEARDRQARQVISQVHAEPNGGGYELAGFLKVFPARSH